MTITRDQAIHEAGHTVVADALGLHVFCIEPHEDGPRCGKGWSGQPVPESRKPAEISGLSTSRRNDDLVGCA